MLSIKHPADIQKKPASHQNKTTQHESPRRYVPAREVVTMYPENRQESTPHPVRAQPGALAHHTFDKTAIKPFCFRHLITSQQFFALYPGDTGLRRHLDKTAVTCTRRLTATLAMTVIKTLSLPGNFILN
jgi:hypothetical protein